MMVKVATMKCVLSRLRYVYLSEVLIRLQSVKLSYLQNDSTETHIELQATDSDMLVAGSGYLAIKFRNIGMNRFHRTYQTCW